MMQIWTGLTFITDSCIPTAESKCSGREWDSAEGIDSPDKDAAGPGGWCAITFLDDQNHLDLCTDGTGVTFRAESTLQALQLPPEWYRAGIVLSSPLQVLCPPL